MSQFVNTPLDYDRTVAKPGDLHGSILFLQNSDFDKDGRLLPSPKLKHSTTLIMIQADWCGACKVMKPAYQKTANMIKTKGVNINVCTIDYDEGKNLMDRIRDKRFPFTVEGFPTVVLYNDSKYITHKAGAMTDTNSIVNFVNHNIQKTSKPTDDTNAPVEIRRGENRMDTIL
jgi:thiol-disulfide isomerase/thioredoxin